MDNNYPSLYYELPLWQAGLTRLAGIDEAGRGAWAGPVCAAVVILPPHPLILRTLHAVRDSKLMTPSDRSTWAPRIRAAAAAWGVGFASSAEIDALGILPATRLAALRALQSLAASFSRPPDYLLTDYLVFPTLDLPQTALVKGDRLSLSIAAASVLAKTSRDALMLDLEPRYPPYGFARHKGYGTPQHRQAIRENGLCEIHRRSFAIRY
jgi:ribonuclease HII